MTRYDEAQAKARDIVNGWMRDALRAELAQAQARVKELEQILAHGRLLSKAELKLILDTSGAVLNGADGGPEIWTADIVNTAIDMANKLTESRAEVERANKYEQELLGNIADLQAEVERLKSHDIS
jgi:hypothetical protein